MKQRIVILSHCFLNDGTKLSNQDKEEQGKEKKAKVELIKKWLDSDVEMIQLPCPEFLVYGSKRWGHASSQFDNPFFRKASREMLEPIIMQIEEYLSDKERFEILGVVGINGSPSCGVSFTYDGKWGGEMGGNPELQDTLDSIKQEQRPGVFIDVIKEMLQEKNIELPFYSIETFPDKF